MRVCMRVCMEIGIRTHDHDQHSTGHGTPPEKGGLRQSIQTKFVFIDRSTRKKRKKVKKSL